MKKGIVFVILYPGCISFEVVLACELLSSQYEIVTVSPDGNDVVRNTGLPIKINKSFNEINLQNCKAILIPGGDPRSLMENNDIEEILNEANNRNILLAAICAGPILLAKSGVLKGKKIAHGYTKDQLKLLKDFFADVLLTDDLLIVDENIITAKPMASIDFAVEVACRLGVVDGRKAHSLKEYYRGTSGRKIRPVAFARIQNDKGQFLLFRGYDQTKNEYFYRPLGGGIEFQETAKEAIAREFLEEIGQDLIVGDQYKVIENLFTYEGYKGHEIVFLYEAKFSNQDMYNKEEFDIVESGQVIGKAIWRSLEEIRSEGAKVFSIG